MISARRPAVAAQFVDDDVVSDTITELARLGVARKSIWLGTQSRKRLDALVERNGSSSLDSAVRHVGMFADFARATGQREPDHPEDLNDDLVRHGVDRDRADGFVRNLGEDGILLVLEGDAVDEARLAVLVSAGADLGLANRSGTEKIIPLRREVIDVAKRVVKTAEIVFRTEIVHERRMLEIELEREDFVIEHRDLSSPDVPIRTTRIPLRHEEASIVKTTVLTGEVIVRTEMIVDRSHVDEAIRYEVLDIDDPRGERA